MIPLRFFIHVEQHAAKKFNLENHAQFCVPCFFKCVKSDKAMLNNILILSSGHKIFSKIFKNIIISCQIHI